jgi:excisionase family DNA binding protein
MQQYEIEQFFSISEVARILGYEKSTIFSRVKEGRIKAVELDGQKRITRSELLRYINSAHPVAAWPRNNPANLAREALSKPTWRLRSPDLGC